MDFRFEISSRSTQLATTPVLNNKKHPPDELKGVFEFMEWSH